ncbi:FAD-binding oxidoreductase [Neorhizobium lilium]|uniref:FAD-binding oxidoreductase n=1 Tax=Neorhizobium lilium TaxID=2503024 RepID=A0A444LI58_9HYPH|nr:FAD-dependent oxidoreductase [Neorhizobium lilium]RWX78740.1 FAD-binding oxidoreductase [Neorhizobium lilium]
MAQADNAAGPAGQLRSLAGQDLPASCDLVILGGGIMGLWAAVQAERAGIDTVLVDQGQLGQGASGGLLGALMPHMPDQWNDKKQFQFDALVSLEREVAEVEAATGISCGYRRSGRLIPLPKPHLRDIALRRSQDARDHWRELGPVGDRQFQWNVLDTSPESGWPDASFTEAGLVHDTLAARVSPRGLISALAAFLRMGSHVRIVAGLEAQAIDTQEDTVLFSGGQKLAFGHCIIAAGYRSFPLIEAISAPLPRPVGQPVKGQAALLRADVDPGLPVIFLNGLYVVAHEDGHVAIGSTSEEEFADAYATDERLDDLISRARALVPALRDAPVVERWAGLRPKAIGRDPMVGPHPDHGRIVALTGGFKVSFGLAHALAAEALAAVAGRSMTLPASFTLANHLSVAAR